ncbi:MAG: MFS transporter, partial [Pseudomonadota bacterium]
MSARPSMPLLLPALACAMGAGPFSTQILGPALPGMIADLDAPVWAGQLALSGGLAAIAAATLVYGVAADRFGRRPALLWGQAAFALGSLGGALAASLDALILARVLQSAGAAAGLALARPILIDVYGPGGAAKRFTALLAAMVIAPMIAPAVGGLVSDVYGWRATFIVSLIFALGLALALAVGAPETRRPTPGARRRSLWADAKVLFGFPAFRGYAAVGSLALGVFFAFVGAA